jgi:tRNA splicing endonuclease
MCTGEYKVFKMLKPKYYLMDGSKFGALFLAYESDPETNHATCLIFINGGIV